jgi:ABC-type bacteriocin/lantibiotic exporter with double-glycine peptidase domain
VFQISLERYKDKNETQKQEPALCRDTVSDKAVLETQKIRFAFFGGLLPFKRPLTLRLGNIPQFILDELMGAQRLQSLSVFTGSLLLCILFGNTLINYFWKKYYIGSMKTQHYFIVDLFTNLYDADIEQIEAASFREIATKAGKFVMADGTNFGGILKKAMDVAAHIITLVGIVSIISVLNPFVVIAFIGLTIVTAWFNSLKKKANIKLDMERAPYERRGEYCDSLAMGQHFLKETRVNTMAPLQVA